MEPTTSPCPTFVNGPARRRQYQLPPTRGVTDARHISTVVVLEQVDLGRAPTAANLCNRLYSSYVARIHMRKAPPPCLCVLIHCCSVQLLVRNFNTTSEQVHIASTSPDPIAQGAGPTEVPTNLAAAAVDDAVTAEATGETEALDRIGAYEAGGGRSDGSGKIRGSGSGPVTARGVDRDAWGSVRSPGGVDRDWVMKDDIPEHLNRIIDESKLYATDYCMCCCGTPAVIRTDITGCVLVESSSQKKKIAVLDSQRPRQDIHGVQHTLGNYT